MEGRKNCQQCPHKKHCNKYLVDCKYFEYLDKRSQERFKERVAELYNDLSEIYNNLIDDLEMDPKGEKGYKNEKEVVKAIKRYTKKVIDAKLKKWQP